MKTAVWISITVVALIPSVSTAQDESHLNDLQAAGEAGIGQTTIGGKWYINFRIGDVDGDKVSRFGLDRGYIIIKHQLTSRLSGRITPDISMDREGDGEGDLEVRLKYLFLDFKFDDLWLFTEPHVEFGLAHRPWLDYEEHINHYRVQGTMYLERNGIFNSGDYGIGLFSLLGGSMDDGYRARVSDNYPGRYGSLAVGIYNGGGYHGIERNTNKTFEGRLSLRPLPDYLPGLQFSYHGVYGAGNDVDGTDWTVNLLYASWESEYLVVSGQRYWGAGNFKATDLDANGSALRQNGYSFFGELRLPQHHLSLIGRYDHFDDTPSAEGGEAQRFIGGVAYHLKNQSKVVVDYDAYDRDGVAGVSQKLFKLSMEFSF